MPGGRSSSGPRPGRPRPTPTVSTQAPARIADAPLAGSDEQTLAVVDTGVDATHPALAGRVLPGRNVLTDTADANDDNGHGTVVAGIAAGNHVMRTYVDF